MVVSPHGRVTAAARLEEYPALPDGYQIVAASPTASGNSVKSLRKPDTRV